MDGIIFWADITFKVLGVLLVTLVLCYFTTGLSNIAGTVFERKSTPEQRATAAEAEKGTVRGGKRQAA